MNEYTPVELLQSVHDRSQFDCGVASLNVYLQKYALQNQKKRMIRNYVTCKAKQVVGFYSLVYGSVGQDAAPKFLLQGGGKYALPVMILARLAVTKTEKGNGLGKALLKNAILRTLQAADIAGLKAVFVQAKNNEVKQFYEQYGFMAIPNHPLHLFLPLNSL